MICLAHEITDRSVERRAQLCLVADPAPRKRDTAVCMQALTALPRLERRASHSPRVILVKPDEPCLKHDLPKVEQIGFPPWNRRNPKAATPIPGAVLLPAGRTAADAAFGGLLMDRRPLRRRQHARTATSMQLWKSSLALRMLPAGPHPMRDRDRPAPVNRWTIGL